MVNVWTDLWKTWKVDVLEDILESSPYYKLSEERRQRIKNLFKGYKSLTGAMRQELVSLGIEITEVGKHYKITYRGDRSYIVTPINDALKLRNNYEFPEH